MAFPTGKSTGTRTTIPDGLYFCDGITDVLPACEGPEGPIFVENLWGVPQIQLKLRNKAGGEGPAIGISVPDFYVLAHSFGKLDMPVTYENRTDPGVLAAVIERMKSPGGESFTFQVKNGRGWAQNYLPSEMGPPEGMYRVQLVEVHRPDRKRTPDGKYVWEFQALNGMNGPYEALIAEFEIVGGFDGKPSPYNGYRVAQFMINPFVDEIETEEGLLTTKEAKTPLFRRDGTHSTRWSMFMQFFAPAAAAHIWQQEGSPYGVNELEQPQYVIVAEALKVRKSRLVVIKQGSNGPTFDMDDLAAMNPPGEEPDVEDEVTLADLVNKLNGYTDVQLIEDGWNDSNVEFTDEGKQWAKDRLGGPAGAWAQAELPEDKKKLHLLNAEERKRLVDELDAFYTVVPDSEDEAF